MTVAQDIPTSKFGHFRPHCFSLSSKVHPPKKDLVEICGQAYKSG